MLDKIWTGVLDFTSKLVIPDWGALVNLIPVAIFAIVVLWLLATVWRFAHHRSDMRNDQDATRMSFWYEPRPNVSHDGRWVLFTSNWEKTLGTDPTADPTSGARHDVFVVELKK